MTAVLIAAAVAAAMVLSAPRIFLGPTLYDRVLAVRTACAHATLVAAALAVAAGRDDWVDVGFAFAMVGLVLSVAVLKFFRARTFQSPLTSASETS